MTWVNLSSVFQYGTTLTSTQMQNLRDNIAAAFNGDSGAPSLQTNAIADGAVTHPKIGTAAVGPNNLYTGCMNVLSETSAVTHTDANSGWSSMNTPTHFAVYKVAGVTTLTARIRARRNVTGGTHYWRLSLNSGAVYSTTHSTSSNSFTWASVTADISGFTDDTWVPIELEGYDSNGYVSGFVSGMSVFITG